MTVNNRIPQKVYLQQYPASPPPVPPKKEAPALNALESKLATFFAWAKGAESLTAELFQIDKTQMEANRKVVISIENGAILHLLIKQSAKRIAQLITTLDLPAKSTILEMINDPKSEVVICIEAAILKALANLINATPAQQNKPKSLADLATFIFDMVNRKGSDPKIDLRFREAESKNDTVQMKKLMQEIFSEVLIVAFPKKHEEFGINFKACAGNGETIAIKIWDAVETQLPALLIPLYKLIVEMRNESETQQKSFHENQNKGGKGFSGIAHLGAFLISGAVFGACQTTPKGEPGSITSTVVNKFTSLLSKFFSSSKDEKETKSKKTSPETNGAKEEHDPQKLSKMGGELASKLLSAASNASNAKTPHPLHKKVAELFHNRLHAVLSQALAHLVHPSKQENLISALFDALKPIALKIYFERGKDLKDDYHAIAKKNPCSTERLSWIQSTFAPYATAIIKELKLDQELARRDPKVYSEQIDPKTNKNVLVLEEAYEIKKLIDEQAPSWLFELYGVILKSEPAISAWLHPEEADQKACFILNNSTQGPIYQFLTRFITDKVMEVIPEKLNDGMADTLSEKIIIKICQLVPEMQGKEFDEARKELKEWFCAEIKRVGSDASYESLRKFIQQNITGMLWNIFKEKGKERSPSQFVSDCLSASLKSADSLFKDPKRKIIVEQFAKLSKLDAAHKITAPKPAAPQFVNGAVRADTQTIGLVPQQTQLDRKVSAATTVTAPKPKPVLDPKYVAERQLIVDVLIKEFQPIARTAMQFIGIHNEARLSIAELNAPSGEITLNANGEKEVTAGGEIEVQFAGFLVEASKELLGPYLEESQIENQLYDIFYDPKTMASNDPNDQNPRANFQGEALQRFWKSKGVTEMVDFTKSLSKQVSKTICDIAQKKLTDVATTEKLLKDHEKKLKLKNPMTENERTLLAAQLRNMVSNPHIREYAESTLGNSILPKAAISLIQHVTKEQEKDVKQKESEHHHFSVIEKLLTKIFKIFERPLKSFGEPDEKSKEANSTDCTESVKELFKLFGDDLDSPSHPLSCIPGIDSEMKKTIWEMGPQFLAEYLNSTLKDMNLRSAAKKALEEAAEVYRVSYTDEETKAKGARPLAEFSLVLKAFVRDTLPILIADKPLLSEFIRTVLFSYLPESSEGLKEKIVEFLADNIINFAKSNSDGLKNLQEFAGNIIEPFIIIALNGILQTLHQIEHQKTPAGSNHDTSFTVERIIILMKKLSIHIEMINQVTDKLKCSNPYEIPTDVMRKECGDQLHPSLRPIVISAAEREAHSKLTPQKQAEEIQRRADEQEMKEFFNPLFENLVIAMDLKASDLPLPSDLREIAYKLLCTTVGPKILKVLYMSGTTTHSQDSIKLAIIEQMKIAIDTLNQSDNAKEENALKISVEQKKRLIAECGDLYDKGLGWVLKDNVAYLLLSNIKAFQRITKDTMATKLLTKIEAYPLTKMFLQIIMSATASLHPGSHELNGEFSGISYIRSYDPKIPLGVDKVAKTNIRAKDVSFASGTEQMEELKAKWEKDRRTEKAGRVISECTEQANRGVNKVISAKLENWRASMANCGHKGIKCVVRKESIANKISAFFGWLAGIISRFFQLLAYITGISRLYHYIQNRVNTSNVTVSDNNIKMEVNESLVRTLILDGAKRFAERKKLLNMEKSIADLRANVAPTATPKPILSPA